MISERNYTITRGLSWERLIIVKDRRTHRIIKPTDAWATVQTSTTTKKNIPVTITGEGGIMLILDESETRDLPLGDLVYDVVAVYNRRSALAGGGWASITTPVASGTITVSDAGLVSHLNEGVVMEIRFKKGADYRNTFTWADSAGNLLTVSDAYMQAKNSSGTTVLDIRWFSSAPNEATISALPASQRGYLAPATGESLELHISELNSIPAGTYSFDIFVQGDDGDWHCLSEGSVVVESSVSTRPS